AVCEIWPALQPVRASAAPAARAATIVMRRRGVVPAAGAVTAVRAVTGCPPCRAGSLQLGTVVVGREYRARGEYVSGRIARPRRRVRRARKGTCGAPPGRARPSAPQAEGRRFEVRPGRAGARGATRARVVSG